MNLSSHVLLDMSVRRLLNLGKNTPFSSPASFLGRGTSKLVLCEEIFSAEGLVDQRIVFDFLILSRLYRYLVIVARAILGTKILKIGTGRPVLLTICSQQVVIDSKWTFVIHVVVERKHTAVSIKNIFHDGPFETLPRYPVAEFLPSLVGGISTCDAKS